MVDWSAYFLALAFNVVIAVVAWLYSVARKDVSIVDSLWSLMILASLAVCLLLSWNNGHRAVLVLVLLAVWALRLSVHITVRNHGHGEDRRYQEIRRNNEPGFWWKSLYIVFGLQAFLAWVVSLPAVAAAASPAPLVWLDLAAVDHHHNVRLLYRANDPRRRLDGP